jgi:arsenate reductase-like glutaredoxin family protein
LPEHAPDIHQPLFFCEVIEPKVVEYLKTPPMREELKNLIGRTGLTVRDVLRKKGTPYAEVGVGRSQFKR